MQTILQKMDEKLLVEVDEANPHLLQTIRISKNMHYLTERLPKPNYSPLKLKKIDRARFVQTIGINPSHDGDSETMDLQQNNSDVGLSRLPKI